MRKLKTFIIGAITLTKAYKGVNLDPKKAELVKVVRDGNKTINIYHMPDINKMQICYGAMFRHGITNKCFIAVDDALLASDQWFIDAIIGHEVGHCVLGHKKMHLWQSIKYIYNTCITAGRATGNYSYQSIITQRIMDDRQLQEELEADQFAVEYAGKESVVLMLNHFNNIMPNNEEVKARYENITGEKPMTELEKAFKNFFEHCR